MFWYIVSSFSLLKIFSNFSFFISSWTLWSFRTVLLSFHLNLSFLNYFVLFLFLFQYSQKTYFMLFILFSIYFIFVASHIIYQKDCSLCSWEEYVLLLLSRVFCRGLLSLFALNALFKYSIFLLIFCLFGLSIMNNGILNLWLLVLHCLLFSWFLSFSPSLYFVFCC